MRITDILKEFCFEMQIRKYSSRSIKEYSSNINLFLTFLNKEYKLTELEDVTCYHIKQYIYFLVERDRKATYVNTILKNLRAFFLYCYNEKYISKNPALEIKWQKEDKIVIKTFTDEEVGRMIDAYNFSDFLNARNKTIMATLFDTGIRNLELCQLQNTDVRESIMRIFGKGSKERYVSLSPLLKKYMLKYERIKEYYFKNRILKYSNYYLSNTGLPLTKEAIELIVKVAGKTAGVRGEIRCSPHTCRIILLKPS